MIAKFCLRWVSRYRRITLIAALIVLSGCSNQQLEPATHESLNSTLWTLTAAEYAASAKQAYHIAASNLDLALADSQWTAALEQRGDYSELPPAVLMDIDETVLDNSRYNARIVTQYGEYTQATFSLWCEEIAASAVPGAKEFVDYAVAKGVTVIYYSRRIESIRDCTTKNLQALGFSLPDQSHLLLNNNLPATKKAQRRTALASRFRILLLVGDDLDDFLEGSKTDSDARRALAIQHAERWGREWILLPNAMYGGWETSLYGFDYRLPREETLDIKLQNLNE